MPLFPSYSDFRRLEAKVDALLNDAGIEQSVQSFIIKQEASLAKTLADIQTESAEILAKAQAEGNAVAAIAGVLNDVKTQNATLIQELATANASGDQAAIDAAIANLDAANSSLDANAVAEAALANTTPVGTTPAPGTPAAAPGTTSAPTSGLTVTSIAPIAGSEAGGDSVVITGTGFATADGVTFGSTPAASVTVNSNTSITATSPAGTGSVDVVVTDGSGNASGAVPFTYVAPATPAA